MNPSPQRQPDRLEELVDALRRTADLLETSPIRRTNPLFGHYYVDAEQLRAEAAHHERLRTAVLNMTDPTERTPT
jgi:hypothetical protein